MNTSEMDFYYEDTLIGRIYNLTEYDCERVIDMWEALGEQYWSTINHYITVL
jgi:hypothetical protein